MNFEVEIQSPEVKSEHYYTKSHQSYPSWASVFTVVTVNILKQFCCLSETILPFLRPMKSFRINLWGISRRIPWVKQIINMFWTQTSFKASHKNSFNWRWGPEVQKCSLISGFRINLLQQSTKDGIKLNYGKCKIQSLGVSTCATG